jgi:hypothetical protein
MKNLLLCGIAIASILMIQPIPASAQRVHGAGHPHIGRGYAGHGPARFQYQRGGYAHGYGPGYGITDQDMALGPAPRPWRRGR